MWRSWEIVFCVAMTIPEIGGSTTVREKQRTDTGVQLGYIPKRRTALIGWTFSLSSYPSTLWSGWTNLSFYQQWTKVPVSPYPLASSWYYQALKLSPPVWWSKSIIFFAFRRQIFCCSYNLIEVFLSSFWWVLFIK